MGNKFKIEDERVIYISNTAIPLNIILYGPPGTGKTYNTINYALAIIDNKSIEEISQKKREEILKRYDELVKEGRIVFTTFHQSMSYEDFIEGIKPDIEDDSDNIKYKIQPGIFKKICARAKEFQKLTVQIEEDNEDISFELTPKIFNEYYYLFSNKLPNQNESKSQFILKTKNNYDFELFKNSQQSIVVKAGEERTSMVLSANHLVKVLFESEEPFYKSYEYIVIDEILKNVKVKKTSLDNPSKPFVIIIDEINRGNIAEIFGELITLIEEDKRAGKKESLDVMLPYSKDKFNVPSNLYIIGTMNTADRSIEALDTALRRRFTFVEMLPDPTLIANKKIAGISLKELLETINTRIEKLLTIDHTIGHSYFIEIEDINQLRLIFKNKIIPLLQEYFYGDFGKIGLVLGKGFIEEITSNDVFAEFDNYDLQSLSEKKVYRFKKLDNGSFKKAIEILLGIDK